MNKPIAVAIYSGGMDSCTLVYDLARTYEVHTLSFDYGQRHRKELDYARAVARDLGIFHKTISLLQLRDLLGRSSLTDVTIDVPEGHYTDETMKATIVPNRNAIMLSIAYGFAVSIGAKLVAIAAHAGDHPIYPDCRQGFIEMLSVTLSTGNDSDIYIHAPYTNRTKADIARLGNELGVPWNHTWSCYKGLSLHCGRCGTCVERREAFALAGINDPTEYGGILS